MPAPYRKIRELIAQLVHDTIEGGDNAADIIACLAHVAKVPYEAALCIDCGGWADKATALHTHDGYLCGKCTPGE